MGDVHAPRKNPSEFRTPNSKPPGCLFPIFRFKQWQEGQKFRRMAIKENRSLDGKYELGTPLLTPKELWLTSQARKEQVRTWKGIAISTLIPVLAFALSPMNSNHFGWTIIKTPVFAEFSSGCLAASAIIGATFNRVFPPVDSERGIFGDFERNNDHLNVAVATGGFALVGWVLAGCPYSPMGAFLGTLIGGVVAGLYALAVAKWLP
ncbi:Uncharacterised protein [Candidatus Burarchaeum australiense]|nr:Uncharacterised protein [Candidatus Burarchaeum australiense]